MANLGNYGRVNPGEYPEVVRAGGLYTMPDPYDEEDMPRRYRSDPATYRLLRALEQQPATSPAPSSRRPAADRALHTKESS